MSATPRIYVLEGETDCNIEDILGKIVYRMTFEYAILNNYISDYGIYLPIHDKDNYNLLIKEIKINNYDELLIKKVLYYFECIKILGKLKTIIYFNSHEDIDIFIKCFNDINNYYNYRYHIDSIICKDTKNSRNKKLEEFNNNEDISILCSVGILDECIDIPSCDSIYITYNCVSKIRIVQRISRALRKYNNKVAKVLVWCENINNVNPIMSAIKEIDEKIVIKMNYIKYNNKILSLEEKINIQKYNSNKYNKDINNIDKIIDNIYNDINILKYNNNKIDFVIDSNNIIWFKFLSICKILNYESSKDTLRNNILKENKIQLKNLKLNIKNNNHPNTIFINENGLYSILKKSKKDNALDLQIWLINFGLPKIKK
jgi:hypothetical protein